MACGAAKINIFQCVYEGIISMHDMEIERRPYHKNCGCALHNLKGTINGSSNIIVCPHHNKSTISFSKKLSWSHCALSMAANSPSASASSDMSTKISSEAINGALSYRSMQAR